MPLAPAMIAPNHSSPPPYLAALITKEREGEEEGGINRLTKTREREGGGDFGSKADALPGFDVSPNH